MDLPKGTQKEGHYSMTQNIDLGNTNTMTFNGQNVNKLYLNSDLIWEGAYEFSVTGTSHDGSSIGNQSSWKVRQKEGYVCGKYDPKYHNWYHAHLYYNLPTARFANVTKASVLVDWQSASGWSSTTSPSSNKYINGCPTTDADSGVNMSIYATGTNFSTCSQCSLGSGAQNLVMSFLPNYDYARYRVGSANNYLVWGNSNVTNSNAPTSTFTSEPAYSGGGTPGHYQRVGFAYSPGGYAWRNGSGGIGEMVMAFYDPTIPRVTIQYVVGSASATPFNSYYDAWRNVINGATIKVVIGGRNTNCPDVINSGRGWDAS